MDECMKERYGLAKERIREVITEETVKEPFGDFFRKMAQFLSMPLPQQCPADLRYALAKYDAQTILDAYEHLSELARAGLLEEGDNER